MITPRVTILISCLFEIDNRERAFRTILFSNNISSCHSFWFLSRTVFCPAKMRNVAYSWQDSRKMRAFHRRERYTRTIWSVKSITRKNTRAGFPKIGKSREESVSEISSHRRFFPDFSFWLGTL